MKKIESIYLLLDEDKIKYMYVIYHDFQIDKFRYSKNMDSIYHKMITEFQNQTKLTVAQLVENNKIIYKKYSNKIHKKLTSQLIDANEYYHLNQLDKVVSLTSIHFSLLEFLCNHFITIDCFISKPFVPISFISMGLPLIHYFQIKFENKYKLTKFPQKHYLKAGAIIATSLMCAIDSMNLPSFETLPYYYEIKHTDIEDTDDFSNLGDEEYHAKAVDIIFNNLHNNPYLTEDDLNTLLELKQYCLENPYLDYSSLLQQMLTIRIKDRYSLGTSMGSTSTNSDIIYCYPNCYQDVGRRAIILHEGIHHTGSLNNKILDEGMTSIIEAEYFHDGEIKNGYQKEVIVTKLFCEIIGSDVMLEAYTTQNDDKINDALLRFYKSQKVVDCIYNYVEEFVNSDTKEEYINHYSNLCLFLVNEAPDEVKNVFLNTLNNFGKKEKGYFSQEYQDKCLEKQIQKVYK